MKSTHRKVDLNRAKKGRPQGSKPCGADGFAIAANPYEASNECEGLLGIRLEEKVNEDVEITEKSSYPSDHLVFGRFLSELYGTFMYGAEEGQIRSLFDRNRSVSLYASVKLKNLLLSETQLQLLSKENNTKYEKESDSYVMSVSDFSTLSIEESRGRAATADLKRTLIRRARDQFLDFIT